MTAAGRAGAVRIAVPVALDADALFDWQPGVAIACLSGETMGTTWRVKLATPVRVDVDRIHEAVASLLGDLVAQMSHWEPASVLSLFNHAAPGSWTLLPDAFATVMGTALEIAARSAGAFDPAAGRLVNLWGHGPTPAHVPPTSRDLAFALARSGWTRLAFDAEQGKLRQPGGVSLDLSGIAKGYAVDAVADLLGRHGIRHCLVEIGGELAGRGIKPDGEPWWVDFEVPGGTNVAPLRVALHQLAVATSGDYVRGSHTLDPRTGWPVTQALSVSVLHRQAMVADAWATALSVLDIGVASRLAQEEGLACRWLVRAGDGSMDVEEVISSALAAMLQG